MEDIKKYKTQFCFHLILNLAFAIFITFASFVHYPLHHFNDHLFYAAHFLILQFTVFGFLYLLSINRLLFVFFFPIIFMLLAVISYWVYFHDIALSYHMVQIVLETKPDIAVDLVSLPFVLYVILSLTIIVFIVKFNFRIKTSQLKSPLSLLAILAILIYFGIENYRLGTFTRRLPYNVVVAAKDYLNRNNLVLKPITKALNTSVDSLSVIFILGESVRADHLQLNGYNRMTNPILSKRKNIISFSNAYTPLTFTATSVPQILTDATFTDNFSQPKRSLIEALNRSKVKTNWIGNQTPERSYEIFIRQADYSKIIDPLHSELSFQKAYDGKLIPLLKKVFKPFKNQFTVMHMMGSHWWYETRYPDSFRIYKPIIESKHIPSNSKEEMINSYDNTILYLDYFIDSTIKHAEKYGSNTLVIYLSDHGELLGENNSWLHARPGKGVSNPAMILWYSDTFQRKHSELIKYLKSNNTKKLNLDFFFPSMLDLYKIEGIDYDSTKCWDK